MDATILQVPLKKTTRDQAAMVAGELGFSSLQEMVRVFLRQLAQDKISLRFTPKTVRLSPRNDKRYARMIKDIETGKVKTKSFSNVDALMDYLNK